MHSQLAAARLANIRGQVVASNISALAAHLGPVADSDHNDDEPLVLTVNIFKFPGTVWREFNVPRRDA